VPVTIVATPAASDANSYATEAEAQAYNSGHVSGETFTDADLDVQRRALATATRLIDSHLKFIGSPTTTTQALMFPRVGLLDPITGAAIDSMAVPVFVKYATAEYARLLIVSDPTKPQDAEIAGLESMKAGDVELRFRSAVEAGASPARVTLPPSVLAFLGSFVDQATSNSSVRRLQRC
jgi:hypothetical protein